jgi:hypothetical protein
VLRITEDGCAEIEPGESPETGSGRRSAAVRVRRGPPGRQVAQHARKLALEPIAETKADPNSDGFRPERAAADAIEQCFTVLSRRTSAQWILEGDIRGCFDNFDR